MRLDEPFLTCQATNRQPWYLPLKKIREAFGVLPHWLCFVNFLCPSYRKTNRNTTFSRRRIENTLHGWQRRCASSPRHGLMACEVNVHQHTRFRSMIESMDYRKASSKQSLFGPWAQVPYRSGLQVSWLSEGPGYTQATPRPAAKHFVLELAIKNAFATRWRLKVWGKAQDVSQCRNTNNLPDFRCRYRCIWLRGNWRWKSAGEWEPKLHKHMVISVSDHNVKPGFLNSKFRCNYSNPQPQMTVDR